MIISDLRCSWVQANDLLAAAADNISLNVEFNGLGGLAAAEKPVTVTGSDNVGCASAANSLDLGT